MAGIEFGLRTADFQRFFGSSQKKASRSPNWPATVRLPLRRAAYSCTSDDQGPALAVQRDDAAAGGVWNGGFRGCSRQQASGDRRRDSSDADDCESQRDGSGSGRFADYRNRGNDPGLFREQLWSVRRRRE